MSVSFLRSWMRPRTRIEPEFCEHLAQGFARWNDPGKQVLGGYMVHLQGGPFDGLRMPLPDEADIHWLEMPVNPRISWYAKYALESGRRWDEDGQPYRIGTYLGLQEVVQGDEIATPVPLSVIFAQFIYWCRAQCKTLTRRVPSSDRRLGGAEGGGSPSRLIGLIWIVLGLVAWLLWAK